MQNWRVITVFGVSFLKSKSLISTKEGKKNGHSPCQKPVFTPANWVVSTDLKLWLLLKSLAQLGREEGPQDRAKAWKMPNYISPGSSQPHLPQLLVSDAPPWTHFSHLAGFMIPKEKEHGKQHKYPQNLLAN
jgi:hypothetical protein